MNIPKTFKMEPTWPLFGLEKPFFWRVVSPQNRRQTGSRYISYKCKWCIICSQHPHREKITNKYLNTFNLNLARKKHSLGTCPKNSPHLRRGSRSKFSCKRWTLRGILAAVLRRNSFGHDFTHFERTWCGVSDDAYGKETQFDEGRWTCNVLTVSIIYIYILTQSQMDLCVRILTKFRRWYIIIK